MLGSRVRPSELWMKTTGLSQRQLLEDTFQLKNDGCDTFRDHHTVCIGFTLNSLLDAGLVKAILRENKKGLEILDQCFPNCVPRKFYVLTKPSVCYITSVTEFVKSRFL